MKSTELMLGSVVQQNYSKKTFSYHKVCLNDIEWALRGKNVLNDDFFEYYRPIPLTPEIFEKCPLPPFTEFWQTGIENEWFLCANKCEWYGQYVHTLQMFLRSIGLEWDLSNLFKSDNA